MTDFNISIFGNKILFEIMSEITLFDNFKITYYENLNLCIKQASRDNSLVIFCVNKDDINFFSKNNINHFPSILVSDFKITQKIFHSQLTEKLIIPFSILEIEKKIILLIAKKEFKGNSLIKLGNYIIDKNERKIKRDNLELQLSEKEINFLILFSHNAGPINRNLVLKNVWNYSSKSETHTLETHIHRLRKKILQKFDDKNFIKNNNKGYYI